VTRKSVISDVNRALGSVCEFTAGLRRENRNIDLMMSIVSELRSLLKMMPSS
jgi:hypothetical protein